MNVSTLKSRPDRGAAIGATCQVIRRQSVPARVPGERSANDYPLSQVCLRPLAARLANLLAPTRVRPEQVTLVGIAATTLAACVLVVGSVPTSVAALLVLTAWFCDRLDGQLARRQGTASAWGAWLDANLDELADLGLHAAIASAAAFQFGAAWPWWLFAAFVGGKYLFMYGLTTEAASSERPMADSPRRRIPVSAKGLIRDLYHLPGNADVRIHVLVLTLAWNALVFELAWTALYYNVRWMARYVLVARRLRGAGR